MAMTLTEFRTEIRIALSDAATFWSNTEIDSAVARTESLLGRLIPKKAIAETTITIDRDSETLTISDSTGTTSYKPIKYNSETITSSPAGTTYTRDTDYTINYMTGVVTEVGSQMADTDYLISYDQDPMRLDISSLVTNPVRITRVEYPVGDQPPTYLGSFDLIEDYLILHKDTTLTEGKHLRIYYDAPWTAAVAATAGEYPGHLADAIVTGASGFCLILKAEKYVQSAITEVELINAAADSMATPLADINTALDKVATHVTEAGTALTKVALYLETNDTTDNAKEVLANITDDVAELRTAIETALDEASTYLTGAAAPGAKYYLTTGDDYITTVNVAERVAEKHADYARAASQIYAGLVAEATIRLDNLRSYIEEAQGWMRMGDSFIAEAAQRLGEANTFIGEAVQRINEVNAWSVQADKYAVTTEWYMDIAGRYLASGQAKINEFFIMLGFKPELASFKASASQAVNY